MLILQKARRHPSRLRRIVSTRFQVLFHSPPGVLFTFPSRYLSAIGHKVVFRLTRWSWQIHTGFHGPGATRSEEHTSELQSRGHLVCRLLLEKKKKTNTMEICTQNEKIIEVNQSHKQVRDVA